MIQQYHQDLSFIILNLCDNFQSSRNFKGEGEKAKIISSRRSSLDLPTCTEHTLGTRKKTSRNPKDPQR
jgi:hypothetical protein